MAKVAHPVVRFRPRFPAYCIYVPSGMDLDFESAIFKKLMTWGKSMGRNLYVAPWDIGHPEYIRLTRNLKITRTPLIILTNENVIRSNSYAILIDDPQLLTNIQNLTTLLRQLLNFILVKHNVEAAKQAIRSNKKSKLRELLHKVGGIDENSNITFSAEGYTISLGAKAKAESADDYTNIGEKPNTVIEHEYVASQPTPTPVTVLFLAANPSGTTALDLNEEFNSIEDELEGSKFRDRFNLEQRFELKPSEISKMLLKYDPQIVHFSGHGSKEGEIILQDANDKARPVDARAISNLFSVLKDDIKCVVLNACYSKLQATLIAKHIDCVIGMSKAIGDEAATKFAQGFYRGIGFGKDLDTAFKLGCAQIDLEGLEEENTPKILWKNDEPKKIVLA